ncbi:acyltransferase family protein [Siminovitchia sediminis]|uniref:Acyltransferase family protein n=1 Tax=Siminovitchia sediminis TaxID=1274353 RepID=A0ABW4KCM3_9BACI
MNKRIEQLDSLRGLAALTVVMNHLPLSAMGLPILVLGVFRWTGINYGHGAVMLFFVLSGFVLSLPFLKKKGVDYFPYVIKRFFRIYVPYIFGIALAIVLSQIFYQEQPDVGSYENMLWITAVSKDLIIEHLYFLGNIHSNAFNGVIWSLIHELRISLIFPFIVLLILRLNWKVNLIMCMCLSGISGLNNIFTFQDSNGNYLTYFHSIHYISLFILGGLLAKHRKVIIDVYKELNYSFKWLILIASYLVYNFSELVIGKVYEITGFGIISTYFFIILEYGVAIGALGFMISAMGSSRVQKFLMAKPIVFFGKISYSLYLYHLPVILVLIYVLHEVLPLWVISILAFPIIIGVSAVAWFLIEKPSIKIGRILAGYVKNKQILISSKKTA